VRIYNKSGGALAGPFALSGLGAPAPCNSGFGDPVVLYDSIADRWLLTEFAGDLSNNLCIYVSKTPDPVAGGWWFYRISTPDFPDYPKYAVWPDAYYLSTNETGVPAYALDRTNMLTGAVARPFQRFSAPPLAGFGFQALTPADLDGATLPPSGAPGIFVRHRDDEVHNPPGTAPDFIDMWEFHVDFNTPANSTFTQLPSISITDFSSELCGLVSFACFPQPGSGTRLDPLREVVMFRLQYRNFGTHQTLAGNFVTDADGEAAGDPLERGGIRWFELRKPAATWLLHQEGTFSPDTNARWLGASAMDRFGNMAVGYNVTSSTVFPSLRYAGRLAADAPGTLGSEAAVVAGSAANASNRWGDYAAMSVDPSDDCTFWFTGMYSPATMWRTRIAAFRFGDCSGLSVTKGDGSATAVAGLPVTYTIVVTNESTLPANGATVADVVPPPLTGVTWICTANGGGTCTASGIGNINDTINLPAGAMATYTLTGTLSPSATGSLSNTVTVTPPVGFVDPNLADNSATDTDTIVMQADLAITKTDGQTTAVPGSVVTYTIVASNAAGPSAVTGATVTDTVPAGLSGVSWTCLGAGGGTCTPAGAGSINDTVNLPVGATVTYSLSGTINATASGTVRNTASVAMPAGGTDPVPGNNSATDTDALLVNNTPGNAKDVLIGSTSTDTLGPAPDDQNWFRYRVTSGRSYCVEVDNGKADTSIRNPALSVFRADAVTVIGSNDDIADEPGAAQLSRVCYIASASQDNLARVSSGLGGTTAGGFRLRVVETTLFCPWLGPLFSGSGFEPFILIRNTTNATHNATVTLIGAGGSTVGSPRNGTFPPNGSDNIQVTAAPPFGFGVSGTSASVLIAHDGPPGALIANVTTLNFTSGVSYDTPAVPRLDNRP
jgi:uncharacterized repeat protein (TIGR01451 family)